MANRIQVILDKARHQLADPHKSRWSDEVLLSILSEGQQDLCAQALLVKKYVELPVFIGIATVEIPSDFIKLESAWILDEHKTPLKYISYEELNKRNKGGWQDEEGKPQYIIYDLARNSSEFLLYPKPNDENVKRKWLFEEETYGVITKAENVILQSTNGAVTGINSKDIEVSSHFGIVTNILEIYNYLRLCYHYKPAELKSLDDTLDIMPVMDKALKHYVVAQALRNDMDSMNRQVANEEFQFYQRELREIISDSSKDYQHEKSEILQSKYDGGF